MGQVMPTSILLPEELKQRLEALVPRIRRDPKIAALGRVTTSKVMRLALVEGLEVLEAEYGPRKKG